MHSCGALDQRLCTAQPEALVVTGLNFFDTLPMLLDILSVE